MTTLRFRVRGMDCAEEVGALRETLGSLVGQGGDLAFDVLNGRMIITPGSGASDQTAIIAAVRATGMTAEPWTDVTADGAPDEGSQQRGRTLLTAISGLALGLGFGYHAWRAGSVLGALGSEGMGISEGVPAVAALLYTVSIAAGIRYVVPKAWFAARHGRPDMNVLMTIAVAGAVGIGEWFEAATVSFLFAVSLALESWSVGRARRAVAKLMELAPLTVRLRLPDGSEREVRAEEATIGATFVVWPGERVPLDGTVTKGESDINQAPITGESMPVSKVPGSVVYAGTINGDGAIEAQATKVAGNTTLANIIRMVGDAQSKRAPSERWVEKFARIYTPVVLALAVAVLVVPPLFFGGVWSDWIYRALVLLVIGCPCALVISTPVTIVAGLAAAARNGVLVKGGAHLEMAGRLKALALDKTGTLTRGEPAVVEVVSWDDHGESRLLERVAAMEARSDHPLARAIVAYAKRQGIAVNPATDFKIVQGKGATAMFGTELYWLGSHRYLEERGLETLKVHRELEAMAGKGRTVVLVGDNKHVCGLIGLGDEVRLESKAMVARLRSAGIEHVVMLTGDNRGTAENIASQTGVDEIAAELLPEDKVGAIERLLAKYGTVGMVGDGVNDAPALGRASLGIAMGAAGSDSAIETADVALMSDDLSRLPWLIEHSRRTLAIVRQNIAFSLLVKATFVVLTVMGHASLWAAIAADMGASLLVVGNGLRLLRSKAE
ncbi:MAG: heavy metal translocating P-type ATPase [Vicinamibacteria bacterium]|jgi:Cd2+/Zn2+-exporting ATPase|nr:heavy metal translocating P-type ATPase [Vicinamibacteria bacterium]